MLDAFYGGNESLSQLLQQLKSDLPEAEYMKVEIENGAVINEVFESIAEPGDRRSPSKLTDALKVTPL